MLPAVTRRESRLRCSALLPLACLPLCACGAASLRQQAGQAAPAPPPAARLEVDAIAAGAAAPDDLLARFDAPAGQRRDEFRRWARLSGRPVSAHVTGDGLAAAAVRTETGVTVLLTSSVAVDAPVRIAARLPAGLYRIERLTFLPPSGAGGEPSAALTRLTGAVLRAQAVLSRRIVLAPHEAVALRFTDAASEARGHWVAARASLPGGLSARATASVRRALREGSPYTGAFRETGESATRLRAIHRLLLYVSQAEAVARNGARRSGGGATCAQELVQLSTALGEESAALLHLQPSIAVTRSESGAITVSVALANGGGPSVHLVRLGVDPSSLAGHAVVRPPDPALFRVLRPWQTVRAEFEVRNLADAHRVAAEISWAVGETPAHVRPSIW